VSNIVLLHAADDERVAERIAAVLGDLVRYVCAVEPGAPIGRFGPQFQIVALWSAAAARDHLDRAYIQIADSSEEMLALVCIDNTPAPRLDPGAGIVYRHLETALRFLRADAEEAEMRFASIPAIYLASPSARRLAGIAATTAMSVAGGALLAGLSPGFVSDAVSAFAGEGPPEPVVATVVPPPVAFVDAPIPSGDVLDRSLALLNAAREVAAAPEVTARFETIQTVSISEQALIAMAGLPTQPPAAPAAAPSVSAPDAAEAAPVSQAPQQLSALPGDEQPAPFWDGDVADPSIIQLARGPAPADASIDASATGL
jgi:hypothetical protein